MDRAVAAGEPRRIAPRLGIKGIGFIRGNFPERLEISGRGFIRPYRAPGASLKKTRPKDSNNDVRNLSDLSPPQKRPLIDDLNSGGTKSALGRGLNLIGPYPQRHVGSH